MLIVIPSAIIMFVCLLVVLFVEALKKDKHDISESKTKREKHLYEKEEVGQH